MHDRRAPANLAFTGYYGMRNYGDDLFGLICAHAARRHWGVNHPRLISPPIPGVDAAYAIDGPLGASWFGASGLSGRLYRLAVMAVESVRNDMIVLGGGSVLSAGNMGTRDLLRWSSAARGLRLAGIGVSIGPFASTTAERRVARFLHRFEYLAVRDSESIDWARSLGVRCPVFQTTDLAGLMPTLIGEAVPVSTTASSAPLGLSLCRYESLTDGDVERELRRNAAIVEATVDCARRHGLAVRIFSLNGHPAFGDDALALSAHEQCRRAGVAADIHSYAALGVEATWRALASCRAILSVRLHGAITAHVSAVPFALVEYHRKCTAFLADIGQAESLRLSAAATDSAAFARVLDHMLADPLPPAMSVSSFRSGALETFTRAPWASPGATP
jgi:polysaccharide pyruvyl transferase WcaK-like protein